MDYAKARHFREAAGHQCRTCIESEAQPVADTRRNRDHIFDCAADFNADHIVM